MPRSVCSECLNVIDARMIIDNERVIMRKEYLAHGSFNGLVGSDTEIYLNSLPYNRPGESPRGYSAGVIEYQ